MVCREVLTMSKNKDKGLATARSASRSGSAN